MDLGTFDSYEEYIEFGKQVFDDEEDPDIITTWMNDFPITEWLEDYNLKKSFPKIVEFENLDCTERDAFLAYFNLFEDDDFEKFDRKYKGRYESMEDFAREELGTHIDTDSLGNLIEYFDFASYADELFSTDYEYVDEFVFFRR